MPLMNCWNLQDTVSPFQVDTHRPRQQIGFQVLFPGAISYHPSPSQQGGKNENEKGNNRGPGNVLVGMHVGSGFGR
jgi:hypothetical protein